MTCVRNWISRITKPRPHPRNRKYLLAAAADVGANTYIVAMAFTDQSFQDPTDKETWDKLSLWDRRTDAMAPLTEKQMDSVLELRAAAETLSVPSEVIYHSLARPLAT